MGVNPELNELQKEVTRKRILDAGFRLFVDKNIDKVTMQDVADAAGIGIATVYRYYGTKLDLVMGISAWKWADYEAETKRLVEMRSDSTAAERFDYYLESFLNLYRSNRDLLRFNQLFNGYVEHENVSPEVMKPYTDVVRTIADRFHLIYELALTDHTLRTDIPEREMFWATMHLMMAVITRYAVGLAFKGALEPEEELKLQKKMLLREFVK